MALLYTYAQSGNSYKVRLLAALIGIKLDTKEIDFIGDEQHSPEFLAINPRGEVPVLVDGDKAFRDSASILTYLAGTHAKDTWWSNDVAEQAAIVDWLAFAASWVQFGVFTARAIVSFGGPYNGLGRESNETTLREATTRGVASLKILDQALDGHDWLALGRPTIGDIAVFVYVALAPMGDISLEPYKNVRAWIERIKSLPNFFPIDGLDDPNYRRANPLQK